MDEEHSDALRAWALAHDGEIVACDLMRVELLRVARRRDAEPSGLPPGAVVLQAQSIVDAIDLVPIPRHLFRTAGLLDPPQMRTLDALHLAAALELGDDLSGLVTYDAGMADAARRHAIKVVQPA